MNTIENGVNYLNNLDPEWYNKIYIHLLDMRSDRYCIIGQLYGSFKSYLDKHYLSLFWAEDHGFGFVLKDEYSVLEEQWIETILFLRSKYVSTIK